MHTIQHQANDSSGLAPTRGESARLAFALTFMLVAALPLTVLGMTAPKFLEVFKDFGVQLGQATLLVLRAGESLGNPLVIAVIALCTMITAWALHPMLRDSWWKLALWWVLLGGMLLGGLLAYILLVLVPLTAMIESMQAAS